MTAPLETRTADVTTAARTTTEQGSGHVLAALLAGAVVLGADLAAGPDENFAGLFMIMPLIASTAGPVGQTVQMAVLGTLLALASFVVDDVSATAMEIRGAGVVLGSALAVVLARSRRATEERLADLSGFAGLAQELILRPAPPVLGSVRAAARYRAASDVLTVGGDLYDVALTPHGVRFIVGDAKGKGLDAVRIAASVLAHFRETVFTSEDLPTLSAALDARVTAASAGFADPEFVTAVIGQLGEDGQLTFVSCGHLDGLHLARAADGTVLARALESRHRTLPLGLGSEAVAERVRVDPGDRLIFFTDGVSEARDPEHAFFDVAPHSARMLDEPTVAAAVDHLLERLLEHTGGHLHDDVAILGLELAGVGAATTWTGAGAAHR